VYSQFAIFTDCQKNDWKKHKRNCKKAKRAEVEVTPTVLEGEIIPHRQFLKSKAREWAGKNPRKR
jgi:hypothetical protein